MSHSNRSSLKKDRSDKNRAGSFGFQFFYSSVIFRKFLYYAIYEKLFLLFSALMIPRKKMSNIITIIIKNNGYAQTVISLLQQPLC